MNFNNLNILSTLFMMRITWWSVSSDCTSMRFAWYI